MRLPANATTYTAGVLENTVPAAGFDIKSISTRGGVTHVAIDQPGPIGWFGVIQVGARSGRILRAGIENEAGHIRLADGPHEVRAMILTAVPTT